MSKPDPLVLTVQFRMSVSHVHDCMWTWRERVRVQEPLAQNGRATASDPAPVDLAAPSTAQIPQYGGYQATSLAANAPLAGFETENFDVFNPMDWIFGDWADMPLGPYDFGSQSVGP